MMTVVNIVSMTIRKTIGHCPYFNGCPVTRDIVAKLFSSSSSWERLLAWSRVPIIIDIRLELRNISWSEEGSLIGFKNRTSSHQACACNPVRIFQCTLLPN